jgi:hypothetical protein
MCENRGIRESPLRKIPPRLHLHPTASPPRRGLAPDMRPPHRTTSGDHCPVDRNHPNLPVSKHAAKDRHTCRTKHAAMTSTLRRFAIENAHEEQSFKSSCEQARSKGPAHMPDETSCYDLNFAPLCHRQRAQGKQKNTRVQTPPGPRPQRGGVGRHHTWADRQEPRMRIVAARLHNCHDIWADRQMPNTPRERQRTSQKAAHVSQHFGHAVSAQAGNGR